MLPRMRTVLFPCASCARHIRIDHASCPFCAASVPAGFGANAVPAHRGRLDRIATLTFALTVAGCGGNTEGGPEPTDGGKGDVTAADASKTDGRVDDEGGISAKYGAPPIFDDAGDDAGSPIAEYGAPPITDGGGPMPLYGLAPPWR